MLELGTLKQQDVLAYPGRVRLIATVHDPGDILESLAHLARSKSRQSPPGSWPEPIAASP